MSGQVSRGSAGEYQADERAGVARLSSKLNKIYKTLFLRENAFQVSQTQVIKECLEHGPFTSSGVPHIFVGYSKISY